MPVLFEKSGAEGVYRRFKFEMLRLAEKNDLPGYGLAIEPGRGGEPNLRMRRVPGKDGAERRLAEPTPSNVSPGKLASASAPQEAPPVDAKALIRSTVAGLSTAGTRGYMTDETIDYLRETCPGWDLYAVHADFERWVNADPARSPANWQRAFVGWMKRHHEKHRHELRG
jgi:hypothetical protein